MPPRHQATLRQSFCSIPSQTCTCLCTEQQSMTTIMQPFQCDLQPQIQETQRTTHKHRGRTKTTPAAPAAHRRCLSSPAAATLHGKTQCFVLRPPQNIAHATFMQPSQCVSQHPVANLHVSTHIATEHDDNNHATIPMQFATTVSRNAKNYAHRNNLSLQNAEHEPKRPQPHPPHTGGTFRRRLQPLYTEKCKVSCSGFLPNSKPMQHSCGHYNAFCSVTWLTCISLPTWKHQMTTIMQPFQCDL